jgi:hypothetical protein
MPESPLLMVPDGFRVDRVFMNLQGRHTADVRYDPERPGRSGGALGYSWSSYQAAADEAVAYLQDVEQDHRPAPTGDDDA